MSLAIGAKTSAGERHSPAERFMDWQLIGSGGVADVFRVLDKELGVPLAIKILNAGRFVLGFEPPAGLGDGSGLRPSEPIDLAMLRRLAFVRTAQAIPFEAPDGEPVSLVFAMLVPEHATEAHLEILSELAQMFSDASLRAALTATQDIQAAHRLITEWSPYAPAQRSAAV